jgi:hypothetical protein
MGLQVGNHTGGKMSFTERMNEVRERMRAQEEGLEQKAMHSPSWDEDLFKNGWPNCWGDFNNIMP